MVCDSPLFTHSSVDKQLCCLHFPAILNNAAADTGVQMSAWVLAFSSSEHILEKELLDLLCLALWETSLFSRSAHLILKFKMMSLFLINYWKYKFSFVIICQKIVEHRGKALARKESYKRRGIQREREKCIHSKSRCRRRRKRKKVQKILVTWQCVIIALKRDQFVFYVISNVMHLYYFFKNNVLSMTV